MNHAAHTIPNSESPNEAGAYGRSLDVEALERAHVQTQPFPYLIVPGFVRAAALPAIGRDFPKIDHHGSFPLSS